MIYNHPQFYKKRSGGSGGAVFYIESEVYEFEPGMTWREWANSSYNTGGYNCALLSGITGLAVYKDANYVVCFSAEPVKYNDVIIDGETYTAEALYTFTLDDETCGFFINYNTWYRWCSSSFNKTSFSCAGTSAYVQNYSASESKTYYIRKSNALPTTANAVKGSAAITAKAAYYSFGVSGGGVTV